MTVSFGVQTPRWPVQGCSTASTSQPNVSLTHESVVTFLVRTVDPDQLESGKAASQRFQEEFAACRILDLGLLDQHLQDQARGIHEEMPLAPFHFLAAVIPASPPF